MSGEQNGNGYLCSLYAEKVDGIYERMKDLGLMLVVDPYGATR